jgi:hypothetical protein
MNHYQINDNNSLSFQIEVKKVFSENTYLAAGWKYKIVTDLLKKKVKKKVPHLYKRQDVSNYQKKLVDQLYEKYKDYVLENQELFKNKKFLTIFTYELNPSTKKRDLSNMKKLLEDSFVNFINKVLKGEKTKFDDSLIYETREIKVLRSKSEILDNEKVTINIFPIL